MPPVANKSASYFFRTLLIIVSVVASVALLRDTALQGQDFEVCWKTAHHLLMGEPVYDLIRDGAMSFKYPPWIVPVFLPLAVFSLAAAKWIWGLLELLSLGYIISWLLNRGYTLWVVGVTSLAFWGIWAVHFMDGQITLLMLAVSLWSFDRRAPVVAAWALSAKVFSGFSLFGFPEFRKSINSKNILAAGVVFLALSVPAVFVAPGHSVTTMFQSWSQTASSGGLLFDGEKIRGRDNQGMPALILRTLGVKAANTRADFALFLVCSLVLGAYWRFRATSLSGTERWLGWLALTAVVHPLSWFHFFVFAFPLAAVCLDGVIKTRNRRMIITALVAVGLVCFITRKTMGYAGERLELYSIKSWGVLLLLDLIVMLRRAERRVLMRPYTRMTLVKTPPN